MWVWVGIFLGIAAGEAIVAWRIKRRYDDLDDLDDERCRAFEEGRVLGGQQAIAAAALRANEITESLEDAKRDLAQETRRRETVETELFEWTKGERGGDERRMLMRRVAELEANLRAERQSFRPKLP